MYLKSPLIVCSLWVSKNNFFFKIVLILWMWHWWGEEWWWWCGFSLYLPLFCFRLWIWSFCYLGLFCFNLWIWWFCYLGFDFFVVWVLISILLGFRPKITRRFQPPQPMTRATGFDPNIRLATGPFSIHPIWSGRLQVNHKPNLTQPMDSPSWYSGSKTAIKCYIRKI